MLPATVRKTKNYQVEDLQTKGRSTTKQYFDGQRWRQSCTVYNCNRAPRVKGLCVQHLKKLGEPTQSPIHSSMDDDLLMIEHDKTQLKKRKHLEEDDDFISNKNITPDPIQEITVSSFDDISSTTDQTYISASSITITPADTPPVTVTKNSTNQNDTTRVSTCQYKVLSISVFHCPNQGTYQCPHCEIIFCLHHGLQHQEDLKTEIHSLLTKTQGFFDNIQKLNLVDVKTSCTTQLDQWATTMHGKIDQIRDEVQMTLDHFEKKIHEKSDQLKKYLENHLEQNVGCILTEQLQKFEIDKSQVEKANLEYNRLEDIFHSFNNRQLITMAFDTENQVTLNPPVIVCSDILVDELNLTKKVQEKIDSSNQQKNQLPNNSVCETSSCSNLTTNEIEDNSNVIITSIEIDTNVTTDNNREKIMDNTDMEVIENLPANTTELFQDLFNENLFDAAVDDILIEEVVSSVNDSQKQLQLEKPEPTASTPLSPSANFSLEKISAEKRKGSKLDLSAEGLDDQDMQVVIQYALQNSKLTQPFKILDLSSNQIGSRGMYSLSNALEKNTTLTELDISRNQIGFHGIISLSNALKENKTLTILNLERNLVGSKGAQYLCSALQHNNTLQTLNLSWCCIDEIGAQYLSKTLRSNTSIKVLELADNQFGEAGALCFLHVLRNNKTLCELNLKQNQLRDTGVKHICDALRNNKTLTTLNLSNNLVGKLGAQYLGSLLSTNKTLTNLDFSSNEVQSAGSMYISDAICQNKTLTIFNLQQNRIGQRGIRLLIDAIKKNDTLIVFNLKGNNVTLTDEAIVTERLMENKSHNKN